MLAERAAELQIWSVPVHSPVCEPEPEVDEAFHHGNYAPVRPHCRVGEIKFMRLEMYAEPGWYLCTDEVSQTFVSADREGAGGDKGAVQEGDKEARAKKRQEAVQEGDKEAVQEGDKEAVQEGDKEARAKKRQEAARREKLRCEQIDLSHEPDSGVWELGEDVEWLPRVIPRVPSPRPEVGPDEMATAQATPPRPPRPPEPPIFTIEDDSQDREPVDEEFEGMTDEDDDKRGLDEEFEGMTDEDDDKRGLDEGEGEDEDDEGEDEDDEGEGEDEEGEDEEGEDEGEDEGDEHDDKRGLDEDEDDEHDDKRGRYDKDYDTDETYSDDMGNSGF